jgi:hypothetical protein
LQCYSQQHGSPFNFLNILDSPLSTPDIYNDFVPELDQLLNDISFEAELDMPQASTPQLPPAHLTHIAEDLSSDSEANVQPERHMPRQFRTADIQSIPAPLTDSDTNLLLDDIRTEYHPHSSQPPQIAHFEDYGHSEEWRNKFHSTKKPWSPFRTRLDFEVASLALETVMNERQIQVLFSLLRRCADGLESFTLKNYKDLQDTWDRSSIKSVGVSGHLS